MNGLGITEVGDGNRPFFAKNNVRVNSGRDEMALFNSVDEGVAGDHKMESQKSYQHPGQYNPNTFPPGTRGANDAPVDSDPFGNGYNPVSVDPTSAKSLMTRINKIDGGVGNLSETDFEGVSTVIEHIGKLVTMMSDKDLELWVPDDAPKLKAQLSKIGGKLIPFLNKYSDCIRKLGE